MTRKDYVLLAGAIRAARCSLEGMAANSIQHVTVDLVAAHIAHTLGGDNPRFDRDRFIKATMLEETK
jgi:hypothetical protein